MRVVARLRTHNRKMTEAAVAGVNMAPVLEPAEHAFNAVAVLAAFGIEGNGLVSVGPAGDAGFDASVGQELPEPIAVISRVGDRMPGVR